MLNVPCIMKVMHGFFVVCHGQGRKDSKSRRRVSVKERMDEVRRFLEKKEKITRLDLILSLLIALVSGVIIGFLTNPKRPRYIGCFNGNFNGGNYGVGEDGCEEECEGGLCCDECDEEHCCGETEFCGNEENCCEEQ